MKKQKVLFWIILLALAICELVLAWRVQGFSDFYIRVIFPLFGATYGRIFGLFDFSMGEWLLYFAVIFAVCMILVWMSRFVAFTEKRDTLKKTSRIMSKIFFKLLIFICLVQVQNCFIMYHATPIYAGTKYDEYVPSRKDLFDLRENLVKRANELSETFERDSKGEIIYKKDLRGIAVITMQGMGEKALERMTQGNSDELDEKLVLLSGYYSVPKPFYKSDFFSQQSIKGYYFPFSLEANYNDLMYIANLPDTMCHELSHLKGFIYEDEASFLAYLGCINSGDDFFEYSGILNALAYVDFSLKTELALAPEVRELLTPKSDLVVFDSTFLTKEAWNEVHRDAFFDTEKVTKASETFLDTNLTVNGVDDGIASYSRIVELLLKYYYGGVE